MASSRAWWSGRTSTTRNCCSEAHEEILKSTGGNPPPILDPFAGGGSIPLEAQRLGLEVHASDLNPVAVLINKALIEIPPKWADHPPVFPGAAESAGHPGLALTGLTEDVRRYGAWMRDEADNRIGDLYPNVKVSGVETSVIAWIWARTITCPNPACAGTMPLVRSFSLSKKKGKERYAIPIPDGKRIRFEIGGPDGVPRQGTVGRTGAVCLLCSTPVPLSYIRAEGKAGRMGAQLMAIAAEGDRQRYYLAPTEKHENVADIPRPDDVPEAELPAQALGFRIQGYGMRTWTDLFTNRQLSALTTFSDLIREVREHAIANGAEPGYADAIACYLSCVISKTADYNCTGAVWYPNEDRPKNLFARQAIPMIWDYPEINVFADIGGTWTGCLRVVAEAMDGIRIQRHASVHVRQLNAGALELPNGAVICTDPPYYDNVGYADLSDFFYVWLRRSLGDAFPDLLATMLTPKADELVADPLRVIQGVGTLREIYPARRHGAIKRWPVRERIWLPHLILRTGHHVHHTTGFDREEIIDLCIRINSVQPGPGSPNWPPCLGLFKSVVATLTYMRHNRTQAEIGESLGVSQPTISRAISAITPIVPEATREFVPTADDLDPDAQYILDGTLLPCWSWDGHKELYSGKHKTTGMNVQVACTIYGKLAWISDPVHGSRHDNYCREEFGVLLTMNPKNWIGDKGYIGNNMITPFRKPAGSALLDWQREYNSEVNKIRWMIEQVISHFKNWTIMHTDYRRPLKTFETTISAVVGLHFYRTA